MNLLFTIFVAFIAFSLTFSGVFSQVESQVTSPRMQMDSGTSANDVACKAGYVLMIRSGNGAAACVSPSTGSVLETRGWGTVESKPFAETDTSQEIELEENLPIEHDEEDEQEVFEVNIEDGVGAGDQP